MKTVIKSGILNLSKSEAYERVINDYESFKDIHKEIVEIGTRNIRFWAGQQWTEEEIAAHRYQQREPLVYNEILHKVEHLVGSQMQTRMDVKLAAREPGDEKVAQLLTFLLKWAEQLNDISELETNVFRTGLITGLGACVVYWDTDEIVYGTPRVEYVPFDEICWDMNAKKPDLSDARWIMRKAKFDRLTLKEMFPDFQNKIDKMTAKNEYYPIYDKIDGDERVSGYFYGNKQGNQDRDLIDYYEHYEKVKIYKWVVIDDVRGEIMNFDEEEDAKAYYDGLIEEYTKHGIKLFIEDEFLTDKVVIHKNAVTKIIQTIIIGDEVYNRELTNLSDFPFVVYFAYFLEGVFFGMVDNLISPQIEVNRSFSQLDFALGTQMKSPKTVIEAMLKPGYTLEDLRRDASKTNPFIPVLSHNAIQPHPEPPINPSIFDTIQFSIQRMNDYAGGRNALGFSENAAESGKAVIARAEAGGVARLSLFDNLRLWRQRVAERLVWLMKNFMTPQQIIRIVGENDDVLYMPIDTDILDTIREARIDIIVSEAIKADTIAERYFNQLIQFFQVAQLPPEVTTPILIEYSSLPTTKKEELKKYLELYQQYMQEKAQMTKEQKIQQQVEEQVKKQIMRKQAKEQMEAELEMQKQQAQQEIEAQQSGQDLQKLYTMNTQ